MDYLLLNQVFDVNQIPYIKMIILYNMAIFFLNSTNENLFIVLILLVRLTKMRVNLLNNFLKIKKLKIYAII